jgi:YVTN family beta-propeller protein
MLAANPVHAGVITSTIMVGNEPEGLAYDSAKGEIFVANAFSSSISVISDNNNSMVATISLPSSPSSIVYDSGKSEIFASN